ncbi:DUF3006 family protein [Paenibacillus sp. IHBB 10380]|uniref:DUF3006 family protein n=1 Tax=Paenibacillus sp. IHBB 10380 TaxID=1566358 RepID=UPI0005CFDB01|nr:DUF3006 family protein [Paenibacillus sp. IHBB 10380]AJS59986.1 hypothetical protein UB51_17630 [Paenibacillus sp. IHBB 10380]
MKGIVDSFEGNYVIIEIDGQTRDILKSDVDISVKVGDVVVLVSGVWTTDLTETELREQKIKKLINDVWED